MEHVDIVVVDGADLVKDHGGRDGRARAAAAGLALGRAHAEGLPVPGLRGVDGPVLRMEHVVAVESGAALLARDPERALAHIGGFAARLHALRPPAGLPVGRPDGTWVHGDLCPVNLLVAPGDGTLVAVCDWEDSRVDDPVVDLAWTEWLVRSFHADQAGAVGALYEAYGTTPDTVSRRRAMLGMLARHRDRSVRPEERLAWELRLEMLADLDITV